ncbi:MAG: hypothetical protein HGB10_04465 [Coriobacteriia bacterium]|nr:hypothetical protein [Coriobacteriia bacterium]
MPAEAGDLTILQQAAERIISRYLLTNGAVRADVVSHATGVHGVGVDIVVVEGSLARRLKVKADPYCGTDSALIADRDLALYRPDAQCFALESVANTQTREPGWTLASEAMDLYYYCLAIAQPAEEVAALLAEPDDILIGELAVATDQLFVIPMSPLSEWFAAHFQEYAPRPVTTDGVPSWYRLVPRGDVAGGLEQGMVRDLGHIFASLRG